MGIDAAFAERVLGSLSSGIVGIDPTGALVVINEGARAILGCPVGELDAALGRDCREVLASQPAVVRLLLETLEGRGPLSRAELVVAGVDQRSPVTIGFTLAPVADASGAPCGATMLFRDLTPVERTDEAERLHDRLAALGEMAAGLAHEIRNPLAGMEVAAGLLRRRLKAGEDIALVDDFRSQLRQLAATVTTSLDYVRPLAPAVEMLDVRPLVDEALERTLLGVELSVVVERDYAALLPAVRADPEMLGAAVANLVSNACEAIAGGDGRDAPRLVVSIASRSVRWPERVVRVGAGGRASPEPTHAAEGREIVVAVTDNGPGVPQEQRERIFYPFFTTKQRGSGIGLATVQKIAIAHGGSVSLESGPGGGATFRIHLPVETGAGETEG